MATVSRIAAGEFSSTAAAAAYTGGSFTPTAGSLLGVVIVASGTVAADTTLSASANGLTFTRVLQATAGGFFRAAIFLADQLTPASPVAMTLTWDCSSDAADGAHVLPFQVAGMTKVGATAARQVSAGFTSFTAGTTPSASLPGASLSSNAVLGLLYNRSNPANVAPPSGFTEGADVGYSAPLVGAEYAWRDSGHTSATITWGGNSPSEGNAIALELDAAGAGVPSGSAAGTFGFTGTSTGTRTPKGTGTGSWSFTGGAAGVSNRNGAAGGTTAWTGSATGTTTRTGAGTGTWTWTGAATGDAPEVGGADGTAAGTWGYTGAATGRRDPTGTASGTLAYAGAATGVTVRSGTATGLVEWGGTAAGPFTDWANTPGRPTLAPRRHAVTLAPRRHRATLEEQ